MPEDIELLGKRIDVGKLKVVLGRVKGISKINKEIMKIIDELEKESPMLLENINKEQAFEKLEIEDVEKKEEKIKKTGMKSEKDDKKVRELKTAKEKAERFEHDMENMLHKQTEILEHFKKSIGESNLHIEPRIEFFEKLLKAIKKNKIYELNFNKNKFLEELGFLESLGKHFLKYQEDQENMFNGLKEMQEELDKESNGLYSLGIAIDEEAKTIKKRSEIAFKDYRMLVEILKKDELDIKDLRRIFEIISEIIKEKELKEAAVKEFYGRINNHLETHMKILVFQKPKKMMYCIRMIRNDEVFLEQLDTNKREIADLFTGDIEFFQKFGFNLADFNNFHEKIEKLESNLIRRFNYFEERLKRGIKENKGNGKLKNIAVNVLGIMTEHDYERISKRKPSEEIKKLMEKVSEESYAEEWKNGWDGLKKYTAKTWKEIHTELKKHNRETQEWKELAYIYNKGITNFRLFLADQRRAPKEIDELFRDVLKEKNLVMGIKK